MNRTSSPFVPALAAAAFLSLLSSCGVMEVINPVRYLSSFSVNPKDDDQLHHVVLVWLKLSGNPTYRSQVMDAAEGLSNLPGVKSVKVGKAVFTDQPTVDKSFDVALDLTFEDYETLQEFLAHPVQQQIMNDVLPKLSSRIVVYDFQ